MRNSKSDSFWAQEFERVGSDSLNADQRYCAEIARKRTNGDLRLSVSGLSPEAQALLQVRSDLFQGQWNTVHVALNALTQQRTLSVRQKGDCVFLRAMNEFRQGNKLLAAKLFFQAQSVFQSGGETFAAVRSALNGYIASGDHDEILSGQAHAVQQIASQFGYHEILGTYHRARAMELMGQGKNQSAIVDIDQAIKSYQIEGSHEDFCVIQLVQVENWIALQKPKKAEQLLDSIPSVSVRVTDYKKKLSNSIQNNQYTQRQNRSDTNAVYGFKSRSIPGQILILLSRSPAGVEQIIQKVWGDRALSPSYEHRLHTAISYIRRKSTARIEFDGVTYKLG